MDIQLFVIVFVTGWFGLNVYMVLTCGEDQKKFNVANLMSMGALGVLFRGRKPADITQRERLGVLSLLLILVMITLATLAGLM